MQQGGTNQSNPFSVSAALAAANAAAQAAKSNIRLAGESGPSLAEMAEQDLDAALQLLADRAQYITGANGAAIALRRNGKKDMLCRASTGSNVPQIGALLSAEFGLSGESVRTRQPLRCDDTERDARVNREVCRQLGIASVAVMPVVNDDEVLGVFELFSGRVNAFGERDLSALQRLSEMVETAVRLAQASASIPEKLADPAPADAESETEAVEASVAEHVEVEVKPQQSAPAVPVEAPSEAPRASATVIPDKPSAGTPPPPPLLDPSVAASASVAVAAPVAEVKKPLFWSASLNPGPDTPVSAQADQSHVPPVLRNLHKCQACGFPVSEGRALCVECEEKKWRGQLRAKPVEKVDSNPAPVKSAPAEGPVRAFAAAQSASAVRQNKSTAAAIGAQPSLRAITATQRMAAPELVVPKESPAVAQETASLPAVPEISEAAPAPSAAPAIILSAGLEPSQSWFSANKYILSALLVVAAVVAAIFLLR